jgi:hypothetical protein
MFERRLLGRWVLLATAPQRANPQEGGTIMARSAKKADIYKVKWTAKYGESGEEIFFSQQQVDAWLRKRQAALVTYSVEKVFL